VSAPEVASAQVVVDAAPEDAFRLFVDEISLWWRPHTRYWNDPERGLHIRIEPGVGGRFLEVYDAETGEGFEAGRVTAWEPGRRLGMTWTQVGWPPGVTTDIEVTFEPAADGTVVRLEHSGFERVPDADRSLAGYDSGWKELLSWYAERQEAS
jgi:uncharacterized protein YndB with AHSA1/START domain